MMQGVGYGWGMGFGGLFMIVFWVLVAVAIAYLVRAMIRKTDCAEHFSTPGEILNARYAKGEITRADYERMKDDLRKA